MKQEFKDFDEFWDFYVQAHSKKITRQLHFWGTNAALGMAGFGLLTRRWWMVMTAPVVGYGAAWVGHFFVEGNRPATWSYPAWSLKADFVMWQKMIDGTMDAEVERVMGGSRVAAEEQTTTVPNGVEVVDLSDEHPHVSVPRTATNGVHHLEANVAWKYSLMYISSRNPGRAVV
jgi:hypothetical protein